MENAITRGRENEGAKASATAASSRLSLGFSFPMAVQGDTAAESDYPLH